MAEETKQKNLCCGCIECTPCRWCCCACCCTICLGIIAIVLAFLIIFLTFITPDVGFKKLAISAVSFSGSPVPSGISFKTDITLHLKNPNGPPVRAQVTEMTMNIYSLDRDAADLVGQPYLIGPAELQDDLIVEPKSETDFVVSVLYTLTASDSQSNITKRLYRDCGPGAKTNKNGDKETELRVQLLTGVAKIGRRDVNLPVENVKIDTLVPCGSNSILR